MFNFLFLYLLLISTIIQSNDCNDIPDQLLKLLKPGQILLFGEIHGTQEMPAYFFDVACHGSKSASQLKIGLEAPTYLTHLIQQYIDSPHNKKEETSKITLEKPKLLTNMIGHG